MKIRFKISSSKFINHFFFICNFSNQFRWSRPEYNEYWIKTLGSSLSDSQRKIIDDFGQLSVKYRQEKNFFDIACHSFSRVDFLHKIKKNVLKADFIKLKRVFSETSDLFNKIWAKTRDHRMEVKAAMQKNFDENKSKIFSIFQILSVLYCRKISKIDFAIIFIIVPTEMEISGGLFSPPNISVIHGSPQRLKKLIILEVVIHEFIHAYFESDRFKKLAKQFVPEVAYSELKEVFASSLLPHGYFSQKLFSEEIKYPKNNYLPYRTGFQFIPYIRDYINNGKAIDKRLIIKAGEILEKERRLS